MIAVLALVLAIGGICGLLSIYRGPHHLDRILALDYLTIVGIGIVILVAVATQEPMVLDLGICLSLVGFVTAYVFSRSSAQEEE